MLVLMCFALFQLQQSRPEEQLKDFSTYTTLGSNGKQTCLSMLHLLLLLCCSPQFDLLVSQRRLFLLDDFVGAGKEH
jgi:hypothetical protein